MSAPNTTTANWIRAGLMTLPLYGMLTFATTFDAQPDQVKEPEAWARYVSTTSYLVSHLLGATGGTIGDLRRVRPRGHLATRPPGAWGGGDVAAAESHLLMVPSVISPSSHQPRRAYRRA